MALKSLHRAALACAMAATTTATFADLNPINTYSGNVGVSVDAVGGNSAATGNIQAEIPVGATILQAFLYSASVPVGAGFGGFSSLAQYNAAGITLNGIAITTFDTLVGATSTRADIDRWATARADVTTLIQGFVAANPGVSNFSWAVTEGAQTSLIDGEVLAIVYSLPSLPTGSVVLFDGGQNTGGETTTLNFASPIGNPADPSFVARLGIADSFSCCGQQSTITVNGAPLTSFAGNNDDGAAAQDGSLITVGGLGDDPNNNVASYADDDELYNLAPFLNTGDTSFSIFTSNATADDNIFFAYVQSTATLVVPPVNPVPEPETYALMIAGLGALGAMARRRRMKAKAAAS